MEGDFPGWPKPTKELNFGDVVLDWLGESGGRYSYSDAELIFGKDVAGALPQNCTYAA
ncbi:hypothetical protein D9M68_621940 [compost metagenome]